MASHCTLWCLKLTHNEAYIDVHSFRFKMDDIFIAMKSPDSSSSAVWPSPLSIFSIFILHNSLISSLLRWGEGWKWCVVELQVKAQVNIGWLTSAQRKLINMSSGCLLTVSVNAWPTQTPTRMNKSTHKHTCTPPSHENSDAHMLTHTPTLYLANLAEHLSRQQRRQAEPK